jgi:hypothetical protein
LDHVRIRTPRKQQVEDVASHLVYAFAVGLDDEVWGARVQARGHQPLPPFPGGLGDFDHAEPAGAEGLDGFMMAERGNGNAGAAGDGEDHFALVGFDPLAVDGHEECHDVSLLLSDQDAEIAPRLHTVSHAPHRSHWSRSIWNVSPFLMVPEMAEDAHARRQAPQPSHLS